MKKSILYRFIQTYGRYALMSIVILILSLLFLPYLCLFPRKIFKAWEWLAKAVLRVLGVRVKIEGKIPNDGNAYVVVANHTSFIDTFLIPLYFRGAPGTVFLHKLFMKIPVLNIWMKLLKVIPINPKTKEGAMRGIRKAVSFLKEDKISLVIFPEGTRTTTGIMRAFKPGALSMAVMAEADVLPLGFIGSYNFKPKNRWWLEPGEVTIHTGEIIRTKGKSKEELSALAQQAVENLLAV
jgi:1-acyl-sn-glycerol-3-phosphate acyltransferase